MQHGNGLQCCANRCRPSRRLVDFRLALPTHNSYGTTLEELVTKSSMEEAVAALEKRMTERLDAVEKAASDADHSTVISALTDRVTAVEQAAADADSSAVISKLADRVDAVETVTNNLPADQSDAIASLSEKVDASVAAADATSESVETLSSSLSILQKEVTAEGALPPLPTTRVLVGTDGVAACVWDRWVGHPASPPMPCKRC